MAILVEGQSREAAVEKGKWWSAGPELLTEKGSGREDTRGKQRQELEKLR